MHPWRNNIVQIYSYDHIPKSIHFKHIHLLVKRSTTHLMTSRRHFYSQIHIWSLNALNIFCTNVCQLPQRASYLSIPLTPTLLEPKNYKLSSIQIKPSKTFFLKTHIFEHYSPAGVILKADVIPSNCAYSCKEDKYWETDPFNHANMPQRLPRSRS